MSLPQGTLGARPFRRRLVEGQRRRRTTRIWHGSFGRDALRIQTHGRRPRHDGRAPSLLERLRHARIAPRRVAVALARRRAAHRRRAEELILGTVAALEVRSQCARVEAPPAVRARLEGLLLPDPHRLAVHRFQGFGIRLARRHVRPLGQGPLLTLGFLLFLLQPSLSAPRRVAPETFEQLRRAAKMTNTHRRRLARRNRRIRLLVVLC
mmetsp:Transcript_25032/g.70367  ORF Transcript_25032/g.70367 Transcript_25032/m.70367 type:complete len:209 (+) Transcript_25032:356-982(+)